MGTGLQAFLSPTAKTVAANGQVLSFAFKNSEIVDFSLWFRNGNRRMQEEQATVVWEDQAGGKQQEAVST